MALLSIALIAACRGSDTSDPGQTDAAAQEDGPRLDSGQSDAAPQLDGPGGTTDGFTFQHTEDNGGVGHAPGKEDPKTKCVSCHGADLTGETGPSCYSCHTTADHTISRGGHKHRAGAQSTCVPCHGAFSSTTGALAKGCSSPGCH